MNCPLAGAASDNMNVLGRNELTAVALLLEINSCDHRVGWSGGGPAGLPTLPVGFDPQLSAAAWISPTHLCGGERLSRPPCIR